MRIMLIGASGFIGRYLKAALIEAGHDVIPVSRRAIKRDNQSQKSIAHRIDMNKALTPKDWLPLLSGIDTIVNCAGILQSRFGQSSIAIHRDAPIALFKACQIAKIQKIVQISAISAEPEAGTIYALTKHAADEYLAATSLPWVIIRPSLIYAPGASGGTAFFRAMAALPLAIPLPGRGEQQFQPLSMGDLCKTILQAIETNQMDHKIIDPVGPEILTLRQIIEHLRSWLGLSNAPFLRVPDTFVAFAAKMGNFFGGTINDTSLKQMAFGNTGSYEAFVQMTGIKCMFMKDALELYPAQNQDRLAARLYFLQPILRFALSLLWIGSGIVGLLLPIESSISILQVFAIPAHVSSVLIWIFCFIDLAIGAAILMRVRPGFMAIIQLCLVIGYTIGLSTIQPALWLDPFGPLLKNIPIIVAVLLLAVMEEEA